MNNKKEHLSELDVFNGIAILCVVFVHSSSYYLKDILNLTTYTDTSFILRLLDNFCHGAVTMFIFSAGYKFILTNSQNNHKIYFLKQFKTTFKPFIIISFILYLFNLLLSKEPFKITKIITYFIKILLGYNIAYQLWYIPMYLFLIFSYPFIYKFIKNDLIRFITIICIVIFQKLISINSNNILISGHPFDFLYYYIFFELGVIFQKYNLKNKITKYSTTILLVYIISTVVVTFNLLPAYYGKIQSYFLWPLCILGYYAFSLKFKNNKLLISLGKYSFFIFLFHDPIICRTLSQVLQPLYMFNPLFYICIITILTIILSIALYFIIKSTFLNKILFYSGKNNISKT